MGKIIGYARVSTLDQSTAVQRKALEDAGCTLILEEKASGTSRDKRDQLELALGIVGSGDTLVAYKLDRLARSLKDLLGIVEELGHKGAALKVLDAPWLDVTSTHGRMLLGILGSLAQWETELRRERQMAGIRRAQQAHPNKYAGRPKKIDDKTIIVMYENGAKVADICRQLDVSRASVYRAIRAN